jgi:hypothetical protein
LLAEDRWREALAEARRGHDAAPDDLRAASLFGRALFRGGRLGEAEALLAPLSENEAAPPWICLTLARVRHAQGRFGESAELGRRAVEAAPDDREVLYWAADVAPGRARRVELLRRYVALSEGDSPDRIEDAEGTIRVLEQLGDRPVWVAVERPERLELPLRHLWDETGETIGYVVEAEVGPKSKRAKLLLDTGNPGLYVIQRVAGKGEVVALGEAATFGGGGDRRHRVQRGLFPSFALGGLRFESALVSSTREEMEATGRFHGLLGLAPFAGYRITLDLRRKRLALDEDAGPAGAEPYWVVSGQMLVSARAAGGEPVLAGRSLLDLSYVEGLEHAELLGPATVQGVGGAYRDARLVHGVRLEFQRLTGGEALPATDLSLRSRMTGVEISGYLGLDVLDGSRIVIDTDRQTIRVDRP